MTDKTTTLLIPARKVEFDVNKFRKTIEDMASSLDSIDISGLCDKIIFGLSEEMTVDNLFEYSAEICAANTTKHPNYGILASKIELKSIYRKTPSLFSDSVLLASKTLALSKKYIDFVMANSELLNKAIVQRRDETLDYFAIKTIKKIFLSQSSDELFERPQHMFMRVACQVHIDNVELAIETYHLTSTKHFTHATPTIINSGRDKNQLSSCFLMGLEDNVDGILDMSGKICNISRRSGGIGVHISNLRSKGTIGKSNYKSRGIIPTLRVFNEIVRAVSQNNNRKAACAVYIEPWHPEILTFIHIRKNIGPEEIRARDLFPALWVPDLFMKRVIDNKIWSLFCPYKCPNLDTTWGSEFEKLYTLYESEGKASSSIKARTLWDEIIKVQIETGTPFLVYKDQVNRTSNQSNIGTIKSSNLCTEVVQYSDDNEVSVCNLASIGLPSFVSDMVSETENKSPSEHLDIEKDSYNSNKNSIKELFELKKKELKKPPLLNGSEMNAVVGKTNKIFDFEKLYITVKIIVKNMNNVIDCNFYAVKSSEDSNQTTRPTGIGIQGLADVFAMLHLPFESKEAKALNRDIAETIYYAALDASCQLAEIYGPYKKYEGSPISQGKLAFDLHGVQPKKYDFTELRERIKRFGIRNSQLIALMPTATSSTVFNFNECFEPFTSNIYSRGTLSGDFQVINKYLLNDLIKQGIWTNELKNLILFKKGSIQEIPNISKELKDVYKTVWEIKMRNVIDMAADRTPYVCQSQSMNLFIAQPTFDQMNAMHIYGWKKGLKTGMYYLRTMPIGSAIQFTVDRTIAKKKLKESGSSSSCNLTSDCYSCGS
ncbi:Ribonucleoside-diphosphate reductase large chain 1 [Cucumispora dikerogammari]|nr:Ribonucleoside-diphosphate reductase large chain 1 [Cucumispora dikerogammari]